MVSGGSGNKPKEAIIMTKYFCAGLLALAFLALPRPAQAGCTIGCGASLSLSLGNENGCWGCGGGNVCAGPWYLYFPYEAHFQMPAPLGYPYWPGPGAPGAALQYPAQPPMPPMAQPRTLSPLPAGVQPVGYYYYGQVPSYWYAR